MLRYLRLYGYFVRFSFSRAMEFRVDFFFRTGMDLLWYLVHLAFFSVLFRFTPTFGQWTYDQVLVFAGALFVVDAVQMTLFSNNMWWFPIFVNKGDLDYYLVRPVSSLFVLSLRDFAANSFLNLLMAIGILVAVLVRYPDPLPAAGLVAFPFLLLLGVGIHYAMQMSFLIPVFWMHNAHGMRDGYWALDTFTQRPAGIYRGWMRRILTSVLPFAIIVSYPVQLLFDGLSPGTLAHFLGTAAAMAVVVGLLWRLGLRLYSSASS